MIKAVHDILTEIRDSGDSLLVGEASPQDLLDKLKLSSAGVDPKNAVKIGVIGVTSSGKSATLNALMGDEYLPSETDPETACTVCIHHQDLPAQLFEFEKFTDNRAKPLATEVEIICTTIKNVNIGERAGDSVNHDKSAELRRLHLYAPVQSVKGSGTNVELYDIPGTSEAEKPYIDRIAKEARDDLAGMILVLGADSVYDKETDALLRTIKYKDGDLPSTITVHKNEVRLITILNKCDKYYGKKETDSIETKKEKVSEFLLASSTDTVTFFSAEWALQAKQLLKNSPQLCSDDYFAIYYPLLRSKELEGIKELNEYS